MKLIELDIHNIRGICDLLIKPGGKNLVVWGGNGSGKSAVVDAIDFLLTGRMSRLSGKGTGDIKLEVHGVHIDHKPEEAMVRAVVSIPNYKKPIEIKRCMDSPGNLQYSDTEGKRFLAPIISVAARGQHVLTRREILKYITAEPSDRAQGILSILDLRDIEEIRKTLVKIENTCEKDANGVKTALALAIGEVIAITGEKTFTIPVTLEYINKKREVLKAPAIKEMESSKVKQGVAPPISHAVEKLINTNQLKLDAEAITAFQSPESIDKLIKADAALRAHIRTIKKNPQLLKSLKRLNIVKLGIDLLEADGACPLCDTAWPPGQLRQHLEKHMLEAQEANKHQTGITEQCGTLLSLLANTLSKINSIITATDSIGLTDEKTKLRSWANNLQEIIKNLTNPIDDYDTATLTDTIFRQALTIKGSQPIFQRTLQAVESKYPKTTPEMDAWDTLTKLEGRLDSLEKTRAQWLQKALIYKRAAVLSENFLLARDAVLQGLYDSVRDRFVDLYLKIHGADESKFKAHIKSDKAGIDFKVDFYERGEHPRMPCTVKGTKIAWGSAYI